MRSALSLVPVSVVLLALTLAVAAIRWTVTPDEPRAGAGAQRAYMPLQSRSAAAILAGAGDIAECTGSGSAATAALLDRIPGLVFTAGDGAYESGTPAEYRDCYGPAWGRHLARTHPAPGNHDYLTSGAQGYFGYYGAAAGNPAAGYYSYEAGTWHIIVLNSNCDQVPGGCGPGSPQEIWLRADLATHPVPCTLAYWHHPLFSSGQHGNQPQVHAFWQALYDYHADLVVSGHDHDYERFGRQNPGGGADPAWGIRQFVVGTGGHALRPFATVQPNSEVRNSDTLGVLQLTLYGSSYGWQFVPVAGQTFTDSGTADCR